VKVKDIICHTEWNPGSGYTNSSSPIISILLPTFRRAKSGKFFSAVESVLNQTLREIELIIVDDASTDGSADIIREFMAKDSRVSCLRHPKNVGLPAISEYEAYIKARGKYIAFAFDDDVFYPDALEKLLKNAEETPEQVVYGSVGMRVREVGASTDQVVHLGAELATHNINSWNCISNNAVLVPKHILDDVGLYDPHILMTRLCDWDLWRRISRKYLLRYVDFCVGEIGGPATTDSLGNTYALDTWASEEQMRLERDEALRPLNFPEYDIFSVSEVSTYCTSVAVREMALAHKKSREHFNTESVKENCFDNRKVLVITGNHDACTTIYFDFLPAQWKSKTRVLRYPGGWPTTEIVHASCLILVRQIDPFHEWISLAKQLGIPCYYFTDDNLTLLQETKEMEFLEDFSKGAMREKLRSFSGVLTSTQALKSYFEQHLLHDQVLYFPPSFRDIKIRTVQAIESVKPLVIAFAGGSHRLAAVKDIMLPALQKFVASGRKVQLVIGGTRNDFLDGLANHEHLTLQTVPFELNWESALLQLAKFRPDILIHAPSDTKNNEFKTTNVAMSANVLDAILVVPDYAPYSELKQYGNAYVVGKPYEARSWLEALETLTNNTFEHMKDRNRTYCEERFSGTINCEVLSAICAHSKFNGFTSVEGRLKQITGRNPISTALSANDAIKEPQRLLDSLNELAKRRHASVSSRRTSFLAAKSDLWDSLLPQFSTFKESIEYLRIQNPKSVLELSRSLHDIPYSEYPISLSESVKSISLVFSTDGLQEGIIGIEIVNPAGQIIYNRSKSLSALDLSNSVEFPVEKLELHGTTECKLRVYCSSAHPVYIFELVNYRRAGLKRHALFPLAKILSM
jgi:glycosyltransferase involved in cell wall biosynthesis